MGMVGVEVEMCDPFEVNIRKVFGFYTFWS